jgi:hypothetical protein
MVSRKRPSSKRKGFNISNELLALLLVVAISLSMVDFFLGDSMGFTGFVTSDSNATAAVTIESVTSINWTSAAIDWGTGSVTGGFENATLDTDAKSVTGGNWTASSQSLVLENIGGDLVELNLTSNKTAEDFVGGSDPAFRWKIEQNESNSCADIVDTSFTDINTSANTICSVLDANQANNSINVEIQLIIPTDANQTGALSATITATGRGL